LRTRPFQELPTSRFLNTLEKCHFSNNIRFRSPSKNKPGTRAFQALEGGGGGPSRTPPGIVQFRTKQEQYQTRSSNRIVGRASRGQHQEGSA
jgi:hypothetical protein